MDFLPQVTFQNGKEDNSIYNYNYFQLDDYQNVLTTVAEIHCSRENAEIDRKQIDRKIYFKK